MTRARRNTGDWLTSSVTCPGQEKKQILNLPSSANLTVRVFLGIVHASLAKPICWKKSNFSWISCTWLKESPYCILKMFLAFKSSLTSSLVSTLRSELSLASKTSVNFSSSLLYSTEVSPYLRHVVASVDLLSHCLIFLTSES